MHELISKYCYFSFLFAKLRKYIISATFIDFIFYYSDQYILRWVLSYGELLFYTKKQSPFQTFSLERSQQMISKPSRGILIHYLINAASSCKAFLVYSAKESLGNSPNSTFRKKPTRHTLVAGSVDYPQYFLWRP